MDNSEREAVIAAVTARVRSFEAVERTHDPEGLVAHYASVPEFYFYHDGRRATHDVMAAGVRKALPAVRSLDVTYADLEVSPLGSEYGWRVRRSSAKSSWKAPEQPYGSRVVCPGCGGRWEPSGSSFKVTSPTR